MQWAKNLFVLAPLVFGRLLGDPQAVLRASLALVAFCCASSAVYLFNDLRDREEDRKHPLKRLRPLASGALKVPVAVAALAALLAAAFALMFSLGLAPAVVLAVYVLLNLLYTVWLKHMVILDVMCISVGFVLRVIAGAEATHIEVSRWLFLCTIFLALFLAFSKRRHEIILLAGSASGQRPVLDHYSPAFLDQMINVVTASAVVSYALYSVAPETVNKYHTQNLVYTIPLVLYGIFRYLYLMYQRPGERNPTEAILRDAPFLINMLLWGLAVIGIVYAA
jgi:4-hydroxybenzoate polyprenyltransferase